LNKNAVAIVVAALVLGASIIIGAYLVGSSLQASIGEVRQLREAIEVATESAPSRGAAEEGRLEPRRRYSVNTQGSPVRGDEAAKLTIVEFSDFECPYCNKVNPTLIELLDQYDGRVRLVWKHLPLDNHRRAPAAHRASEAAHRQGKFWEMHDLIFANQRAMSPERYREYAAELDLDMDQFDRDLEDPALQRKIEADLAEAKTVGVRGTPSFFINGRYVSGAIPIETFRGLIEAELGS
jgi:protein-disulfide isomerase